MVHAWPAHGPFVPLHGLGGAKDLPVPESMAIGAGTLALLVSFAVLALAWRRPRYDGSGPGLRLPRVVERTLDGPVLAALLRTVGFAFFAYVSWPLLAGPDTNTNPALGVFYVLVWVGVLPASLLFGRAARALSPIRTLHLLISAALGTDPRKGWLRYPERLGCWPAALGLMAFVWQELVNPDQIALESILLWVAGYALVMLVGATIFGQVWLERADPFEVYSDLLAHLSVWGRDGEGHLTVRSPLANLDTVVPRPGLVAVVSVLFGSTIYDSYRDSLRWSGFVDGLGIDTVLVDTVALVVFCAVVALTFTAAARATPVEPGSRRGDLAARYAHSVVPIVVGYMTAHYLSYFVEQGQQTLRLLSDPMSNGADYLGTAGLTTNLWLSFHPTFLATVKVLVVVLGHVLGVVAAHDRALRLLPIRHRISGQVAMLVLMLCYTCAGLYLLFLA